MNLFSWIVSMHSDAHALITAKTVLGTIRNRIRFDVLSGYKFFDVAASASGPSQRYHIRVDNHGPTKVLHVQCTDRPVQLSQAATHAEELTFQIEYTVPRIGVSIIDAVRPLCVRFFANLYSLVDALALV